ncbi:hypothetical protein M9458_057184 [Cirrhinus mrigala]|uniref:Ig-like domain-containing protein n=1 Tax=Cirrhinus mrigala TaxID=683832 RepID=A0ABD0MBL9_CIRMR
MTTYTGINRQTVAGIPEFFAVTTLDGQQIDYYDGEIKKLIPRQDWMKEFASTNTWKEDTEIRQQVQQIYKNNIAALMEQFNQTRGVHTYQRMYGCDWDDETGYFQGFDEYGYDGEDYVKLDLRELRYITAVQQGFITVVKRIPPLRWCHVTGFYPSGVTITWLRNGQDHDEDVDLWELLPNEDGTFQKTSTLHVPPEEWKKDQYVCVVEHMGKTIQKILTEGKIKNSVHCCGSTEAVIRLVLSALVGVATVILLVYEIRSRRAEQDQAHAHTSET